MAVLKKSGAITEPTFWEQREIQRSIRGWNQAELNFLLTAFGKGGSENTSQHCNNATNGMREGLLRHKM